MEWWLLVQALIQGIVEGLTEFLPVSSTGHLIVSGALIGFNGEKAKVFNILIDEEKHHLSRLGKLLGERAT